MLGSHLIKSWSTTQQVIALSSGEAEYYSMVRGGSLGMGVSAIAKDMAVSLEKRSKGNSVKERTWKGETHRR